MAELTFACVDACFNYDSETGKFYWKIRPVEHFLKSNPERFARRFNNKLAGTEAFTNVNNKGYLRAKVFGQIIAAHRAAWLLHHGEWPTMLIDHVNGDKTDNRIANLRHVDIVENGRNRQMNSNNSSGLTGVHWHRVMKKWIVNVGVEGRLVHLGYFADKEQAAVARQTAHKLLSFTSRNSSKAGNA